MVSEQTLAAFIANTTFSDLPEDAVKAVKNIVFNIVGTTIAGSCMEGCEALLGQVRDWGGKPEATVWIHGGKVPAHNAALINSYMARALDIDDAMFPGIHVGASTVSAALAAAELVGGCSGEAFLTALAVAHETAARINFVSEYDGFDPSGVCTVFGAATVAARLLRLSPAQLLDCLGLAFDKAAGSFQSNVDASLAIRAIQGFSAQSGLVSAQLAKRGITGPNNFLEGIYGYLNLYGKGKHDAREVTSKLGQEYKFANNILFKKHPSCAGTEGATDAMLYLVREYGLSPEDVASIEILASPHIYGLVGHDFIIGQNPRVNAQFNVRYCTANALLRRTTSLDHFEEAQIRDPKIMEIIKKISVKLDSSLEGNLPLHLKADVKVTTVNGSVYRKSFDEPRGAPGSPLTREELQECFADRVRFGKKPLLKANVEQVVALIERLQELEDVRILVPLLVTEAARASA